LFISYEYILKMPLPSPSSGESKDKFISRFMSSEAMKKEFPDHKQRVAVANTQWRKSQKEERFSMVRGFEVKEDENGNMKRGGYIATTHLDSGFFDEDRELHVRDRISKETLDHWAEEINQGIPRSNKVSVHHKREPHVTGVGIPGSARVDILGDGHYGLYVDTLIDKTKESFEDTKWRIDNNLLDSFSIEFRTKDPMSGEYFDNAVIEHTEGEGMIRDLMPGTQLEGWTLASQPMNENCVMIKEIITNNNKESKEDKMSEEEKKPEAEPEAPAEEPAEEAPAEEEKTRIVSGLETKEFKISGEDIALLKEVKAMKEKEKKDSEMKEMKNKILEEVKTELNKAEVKDDVQNNGDGEDENESKEVLEYKEIFKEDSKVDINEQFKRAGKLVTKEMFYRGTPALSKEYKNFGINGNKLEYKGLGITSNQETDTDYLLSGAELSDVFDPVIYNALNQMTVTWNILPKDDLSQKGNNQVQFVLKTVQNQSRGAYTGNAVTTGNVTRQKLQTKFKKYMVGVEVDGDMIAAARGGPVGDVFAQEVRDSTDDLMQTMNEDLFKEVGAETAAGVIGFEYITDSAGNTTLYNLTRSTTNKLAPDAAADTYINASAADVSVANLRSAKRQALKEGAMLNNLVFICDHIQGDKIRGIYDAAQRPIPTSSRFGFEGRIEFDGIPIFEDKDCNDDDIWLVDLETHRIAVWVPPTLEMLGKDADSQKGFIKTYFGTKKDGSDLCGSNHINPFFYFLYLPINNN
jgi:hypothetical protein